LGGGEILMHEAGDTLSGVQNTNFLLND